MNKKSPMGGANIWVVPQEQYGSMRSLRREIVMIIAQEGDTRAADLSQFGTEGEEVFRKLL